MSKMELEIHWRAPLQPKGFLKIIEMFVALLALSLVAGFTATNKAECSHWSGTDTPGMLTSTAKYPFSTVSTITTFGSNKVNVTEDDLPKAYKAASEFFVAWGSLSLFYGVIAICVYMFTTANSKYEWVINYLILTDLIFHVVWVLCWFIASVEWAVVQNNMKTYIKTNIINDDYLRNHCSPNDISLNDGGSYAQAAIGDVFGFTSIIIWGANIFWVVIDTSFYMQWKARRSGGPGDYNTI